MTNLSDRKMKREGGKTSGRIGGSRTVDDGMRSSCSGW